MTNTITALALSLGLLGTAQAAPPAKSGPLKGTSKIERIRTMQPGEQYVLVCIDCRTATVGNITSVADAEKLCHKGGKIHCDGCKSKMTIKHVGPPGKQRSVITDVKYVNSEGKECMVLIPLKE